MSSTPERKSQARRDAEKDPKAPLKIGAALVCLLIAVVLLANQFGLVNLYGGKPPEPPAPKAEEKAQIDQSPQILQKQKQEIEAMPEKVRPKPAGS